MKRKYLITTLALFISLSTLAGCQSSSPKEAKTEAETVGNTRVEAETESNIRNETEESGNESSEADIDIPLTDPITSASNNINNTKTKFINLPEGYEVIYEACRKVVDKEADFLGKPGFEQQDYYIWGIKNNSNNNPEGYIMYMRAYDENGNELEQIIPRDRYTYDGEYSEAATDVIPRITVGDTVYFYYTYKAEWYEGYEHNETDESVHIDHVEVEFIPNKYIEKTTCSSSVSIRLHKSASGRILCDMENVGEEELSELGIFTVTSDAATGEVLEIFHDIKQDYYMSRDSDPEFAVMDIGGKVESTDDNPVFMFGKTQEGQATDIFINVANGHNWE